MYHYTYLLRNPITKKLYIGLRSSTVHPKLDVTYWGSSKHLPTDIATTHQKRILAIHKTRLQALQHEVFLHEKYNVAVSPRFYNKAKQRTVKFDTSGTTLTLEHRQKCSSKLKGVPKPLGHGAKVSASMKGRTKTEEHKANLSKAQQAYVKHPDYVNPRKGVTLSEESKQKCSDTKKQNGSAKSVKNPRFTPWFMILNGTRTEYFVETKSEYALRNNLNISSFYSSFNDSKGIKTINMKTLGKVILGNIV